MSRWKRVTYQSGVLYNIGVCEDGTLQMAIRKRPSVRRSRPLRHGVMNATDARPRRRRSRESYGRSGMFIESPIGCLPGIRARAIPLTALNPAAAYTLVTRRSTSPQVSVLAWLVSIPRPAPRDGWPGRCSLWPRQLSRDPRRAGRSWPPQDEDSTFTLGLCGHARLKRQCHPELLCSRAKHAGRLSRPTRGSRYPVQDEGEIAAG